MGFVEVRGGAGGRGKHLESLYAAPATRSKSIPCSYDDYSSVQHNQGDDSFCRMLMIYTHAFQQRIKGEDTS
jgi:hypothetical protein